MSSPMCSSLLHFSSTSMCSSRTTYVSFMEPFAGGCITDYLKDQRNVVDDNHNCQLDDMQISSLHKIIDSPSKKRVSFADSVGLELVQIRHMTAGRDTPPDLDPAIISALGHSQEKVHLPSLSPAFAQPISNYANFLQSLHRNNVQLESVSVNDSFIIGTVKVKNLAFHKTVYIRVTYDGWASSHNVNAYYVNNGLCNAAGASIPSSLDTFSFTLDIPMDKMTQHGVEFAICYRCESLEFWDNNNNRNYRIDVNDGNSKVVEEKSWETVPHRDTNWTEYAIWRSLESDYTPYW